MQHVFEIDDRGEIYWWVAEHVGASIKLHCDYMAGVCESPLTDLDSLRAVVCDDHKVLKIDGVEKTCAEWAADTFGKPVPMVGTTAV